ncbi:membrane protein [Tepidanaerobacter syntrophicus]|nr:membrane protein [Tepidanaerobacter syntrophicus]
MISSMSQYVQLALMPLIGALIGWGTNLFAVKLIFRPLNPIKVPVFGIEIQGLIPKRRLDISKSIGEALEKEIISTEEIIENLASEKNKTEFMEYIKNLIAAKITAKLPAIIPTGLRNSIATHIGNAIGQDGNDIFEEIKYNLVTKAKEELNLKEMVEEKINSFDLKELEDLIIQLANRELRQIEVLGGVMGFLVGIFQAGITYVLM